MNALLIISGLLLIALVGEIYLRLANPFIGSSIPSRFVDDVGLIRDPNAELRWADWNDDNFVISRTNSLGFLDREPASAERASDGCHIAFIGDSYVEAVEVPIADKFHVRLEEMAARQLPHLDITTQAYGIIDTGQINQIPFYDEYASRLNPKLVVLLFYINDFGNNLPMWIVATGTDPDSQPYMSAYRDEQGKLKLRPPDPEYERFLLPTPPTPWHWRAWWRLTRVSYFAKWVEKKYVWEYDFSHQTRAHLDTIAERPCCAHLLADWQSTNSQPAHWIWGGLLFDQMRITSHIEEEHTPLILKEALEYTAFGIEQFKRRADRDGVNLAILSATPDMGMRGDPQFDRLSAIAKAYDIPVISDYDYIVKHGRNAEDGRWRFNAHWNAIGHQWVAEAVLEWLEDNQGVCD